jgi:hypothetical protein
MKTKKAEEAMPQNGEMMKKIINIGKAMKHLRLNEQNSGKLFP